MKNYSREDLEKANEKVKLMSSFMKEEQEELLEIVSDNNLFIEVLTRASQIANLIDPFGSSSLQKLSIYYIFLAGYMIGSEYDVEEISNEDLDDMWIDAINDIDEEE